MAPVIDVTWSVLLCCGFFVLGVVVSGVALKEATNKRLQHDIDMADQLVKKLHAEVATLIAVRIDQRSRLHKQVEELVMLMAEVDHLRKTLKRYTIRANGYEAREALLSAEQVRDDAIEAWRRSSGALEYHRPVTSAEFSHYIETNTKPKGGA